MTVFSFFLFTFSLSSIFFHFQCVKRKGKAKSETVFVPGLMACDICLPAADGKQFNILIIQCHFKVLKMTWTISYLTFMLYCSSYGNHDLEILSSVDLKAQSFMQTFQFIYIYFTHETPQTIELNFNHNLNIDAMHNLFNLM